MVGAVELPSEVVEEEEEEEEEEEAEVEEAMRLDVCQ